MRAFFWKLSLFFRAVAFRRFDAGAIVATPIQAIASFTALCLFLIGIAAWEDWPVGGVDPYGFVLILGFWFVSVAAMALGPTLVGKAEMVPATLVMLPLGLIFVNLVYAAGALVAAHIGGGYAMYVLVWLLAVAPLPILLARLLGRGVFTGAVRAVPTLAILLGGQGVLLNALMYEPRMFVSGAADDAYSEAAEQQAVDVERLYYAQPSLMAQATARLEAERPDRTGLYAVVLGGTAHQGVFLSEVEHVSQILERSFDAGGHVIRLANSRADPERHPMANRRNLATALSAIAERMDVENDIAFLYLTSHGSTDRFALSFWEAGTQDITAQELAVMLDESGLRSIVLVLSACYSGSFLDDLAGPDRLIITAASAERTSFGCADGNEWTWWGRAFFEHGLAASPDFREAFGKAVEIVKKWETDAGYVSSEPQMLVGERIAARLDRWRPMHGRRTSVLNSTR